MEDEPVKPIQFTDYIGNTILILLRSDPRQHYVSVKLVGTEVGGLWIESQEVTNSLLRSSGVAAHTKTLILFVSYQEIRFAAVSTDQMALDEGAFGL